MEHHRISLARFSRARRITVAAGAIVAISACSPPPPRSYDLFLTDSIARDGTLARCDLDPAAAQSDIECANARRAALAVQLEEERARRTVLERESAAKIEALRREFEAQRARAAAAAAEEQALLDVSRTPDLEADGVNALAPPPGAFASDRALVGDSAKPSGAAGGHATSSGTAGGADPSASATSSSSILSAAP